MSPTADTRERILLTARDLIHGRSYADVGVAEICDRAKVRKGSFYHFFPSKRDLTLAVLERILIDTNEQILNQAFDPSIPPLQRLVRLAELVTEFQEDRAAAAGHVLGCPVGNLATELATQDEVIRSATARAFADLQSRVAEILNEAAYELAGVDIDATAQAMVAYFEGVLMLAKTENDLDVIRRLLPSMRNIRIPKPSEPNPLN